MMSFPWLRGACADLGYSIVQEGDVPLSAEEIMKNYNEVARCSYEQFTAKPYLIPQLVIDVDLCASTLGIQENVEFKRHLEYVPFDLIDAPGFAPAVVRCLR